MNAEYAPDFPGVEFSTVIDHGNFVEQAFESGNVCYGFTTSNTIVTLPMIEYWVRVVNANGTEMARDAANLVTEGMLTDSERDAFDRARVLHRIRTEHDDTSVPFSSLRKVTVGQNGLLQLCTPEYGNHLREDIPFAPVQEITPLADIDVAVPVYGPAIEDMLQFAPPEAQHANAYYFMDQGRVVSDGPDAYGYQLRKVRLYHATADLDMPLPE